MFQLKQISSRERKGKQMRKKSGKAIAIGISMVLLLGGCGTVVDEAEKDTDTNYDNVDGTIVGSGDAIEVLGKGIALEQNQVIISSAGTYMVSGTIADSQIRIDADKEDMVHLFFNGIDMTCTSSAAIYGVQSEKLIITLVEGTTNTFRDKTSYVYSSDEEANEEEPNACIFSKDDITINGSGTLVVNGNYEDGIRSKDSLMIVSGDIQVTAVKDAMQGNDSIEIYGGNFVIRAGDDAIHAESALVINDGTIVIESCYEGLEGKTVEMNGGEVHLVAKDDGVNAAGGSDEGEGFFGGSGFGQVSEDTWISINGGYLYVDAAGDGIDSNGNVYITGGVVLVCGPTDSGNAALDYGGSATINGGILLVAGSAGMAQGLSEDSTQCSILYNYEQIQSAGSRMNISDKEGNSLISFTPAKDYQSVVISCPALTTDAVVVLSTGGTDSEENEDGYASNGNYSGGSIVEELSLTGVANNFGSGGMHGGMNGGMHGKRPKNTF